MTTCPAAIRLGFTKPLLASLRRHLCRLMTNACLWKYHEQSRSIGNCTSIFQQDYTACKTCDFSSLVYHCKIFLDYLSIGDGNPHWALRSWCGISSINSASRIVPNPSWELVFAFQPFKKIQKAGQNRPDLPVTRWRQNWEPPELGGNVAM